MNSKGVGVEPLTLVATAVAVGAAAGVSDAAKEAVVEAYSGLKNLIIRRYRDVDLAEVERRPESGARRAVLAEELTEAGAATDAELLLAAQTLIAAVRAHEASLGAVVGVDLEHLDVGGSLHVDGIESTGIGVRGSDLRIAGDVAITQVQAGVRAPQDPRSARE
ncbi:hypothetical protein [Nocardia amamiensis]|uniref:hypothetical protein n=1 Tax=Nocardia amamiensis TaxID=404578 RepID=UPI0033F2BB09